MRLLSCHLRRVRLHSDLKLSFDPGLTVIGGPNEAGKSTLVEALHKGLFLRATATGRGVEELRARRHGGQPEVEIRFEAGGQCWQLRKRFSGASGTCHLSNDAGVALSGSAAEEALAQLLGVGQPVEGRRIAQLPERWAHLWVRQGEGGANPLSGSGERYDLGRLVEQLQRRGGTEAFHSPWTGRCWSESTRSWTSASRARAACGPDRSWPWSATTIRRPSGVCTWPRPAVRRWRPRWSNCTASCSASSRSKDSSDRLWSNARPWPTACA